MSFDCVIFDLDGTLTEPWLDFAAIRAELGMAADAPVLETIERMPQELREEARRKLLAHELAAAREAPLAAGVPELIERIRRAGLSAAILTRNTRPALELVVTRLGVRFDLLLAREDGPVKPSPAGILEACRRLGAATERTACVGDYLFDIQAANAAGCVSVLLARGPRPQWAGQARHVIETLGQLGDILGV